MRVKVDLHIHSALSPCADNDNTPNNLVNLCKMMDIDIMAVADHNSVLNIQSVMAVGKKEGVLVVPAMEVTTAEDIHVLCLFKNFEQAHYIYELVNQSQFKFPLDKKVYSNEFIMDENDDVVGELDYLLTLSCGLDIYELLDKVWEVGGIAIPAHIDRSVNSLIATLGIIPDDLNTTAYEVSKNCPSDVLDEIEKDFHIIKSSDGHSLEAICENEFFIEIPELSVDCLIDTLRQPKRKKE